MQRSVALWLSLAVGLAWVVLALNGSEAISAYFFRSFDRYFAVLIVLSWLGVLAWRPRMALPGAAPGIVTVWLVGLALTVLLWGGYYVVMLGYPVSRDEHMVVFDAGSYAQGMLAEPLPPEWSGFGRALAPAFLLETPDYTLLVSGYLPVNAALRGWFGLFADPALIGPVMAAAGFVALYSCARRIFSASPEAIWVVLGAYLVSAQVLVTAMTTYAMSAHLAFNLVWLALFLKDRWWSHGLAMLVGVAAMGLHQFVFHPLFAGPFILWLLWRRQWFAFGAYAFFYAAGLLLWISWGAIVMGWAGIEPGAGGSGGVGDFFAERVLPLITSGDPETLSLMLFNLMRALVWNAAFALPLLGGAWLIWVRQGNAVDPLIIALFSGLYLTILAMMVLLPLQGHGWGYRYIHGLIGNIALLAGFGYLEFAKSDRQAAGGAVAALGALSLFVVLPAALWSAHSFAKPHSELSQRITAQTTDFVIVDDIAVPNAVDEIRNRADLSNRPLVFARSKLSAQQIETLCGRGSVIVIGPEASQEVGLPGYLVDVKPALPPDC